MPGGADPRGPVDRKSDITVVGELNRAGVDPHPDAKLCRPGPALGAEGLLCRDRRQNRVARTREGDEERVSRRIDHAAGVVDERVALEALLPRLNRRIAVAELTEQPR